ncbi:hypothetical protein SAMN05443572_102930 [Myxococcus fulvus]|uniref:Immunity MXAN-0049 protein domain-containing protein n=2 Tax=Myxococcus fulvus TaxID=33 RepID=A0A511SWW5_MYXFU|nr:hypothetical protein MFU01_09890 [Myxococcus fulvus]SET62645.1 hypothetical protein SAMN05443572_102930 [Myxococcus fulvus]
MSGREVEDPWVFKKGRRIESPGWLRIPVDVPGKVFDFTLAGISTPVVHVRVATLLTELAPEEVQVIPVEIPGHAEQYSILVATRLIECIDDTSSREVERWMEEDGRPEKVGHYRDVDGLRIDTSKVGDAKLFRTWGWSVALIVSEDLKLALEALGVTGMRFTEV